MTKYHVGSNGHFQRCKATVRNGQNVSGCPLEVDGQPIAHTVGLEGIAASGGGTIRKWIAEDTYRDTKVMPLGDGTFMTSTGKLERVYSMSGELLPLKERLRALKNDASKPSEPTRTPVHVPRGDSSEEHFEALLIMGETPNDALALTVNSNRLTTALASRYFQESGKPEVVEHYGEALSTFVDHYWYDRIAGDDFMWDMKEAASRLKDAWREEVDVKLFDDYDEWKEEYDALPDVSEAADPLIDILVEVHRSRFEQWEPHQGGWRKKS